MTSTLVYSLLLPLLAGLTTIAWSQQAEIQSRTRAFLDAYAKADAVTISSLIDPTNVTMYGSDRSEFVHGSEAVLKMLADDHQLWTDSARFGPMEQVNIVHSGSLASIVFNAPFLLGDRPPIWIRVDAVWKRAGKQWRLIQSSNSVITEHQSASELLHHH